MPPANESGLPRAPVMRPPASSTSASTSTAASPQSPRKPSPTRAPASEQPASSQPAQRPPPQHSKSVGAFPASSQLHWPISPRLKSPPPGAVSRRSSQNSLKQSDGEPRPSASDAPTHTPEPLRNPRNQSNASVGANGKLPRGPGGLPSTLPTVQEGDQPPSPWNRETTVPTNTSPSTDSEKLKSPLSPVPTLKNEPSADKPSPSISTSKQSFAGSAADKRKSTPSIVTTKVRAPAEGSTQNMMVETETVSSIPQSSTAASTEITSSLRPEPGAVRAKPSTETIRPKKTRKKPSKKPSSIASGTNSTKADLFEARVTSEIEGDTSDSDETFVYESNPPEPRSRSGRHHSRTPSTTSMQNLTADRRTGVRSLGHVLDNHRVRSKRSMKFSSSSYGGASSMDDDPDEITSGTIRASHIRRDNENKYQQMGLFAQMPSEATTESDSPFSRAGRSQNNARNSARGLQHSRSPRASARGDFWPLDYKGSSGDESTPLIGGASKTLHPQRVRPRGQASNLRREMYNYEEAERSCVSRISGCIVMVAMIILVILGTSAFLLATTKALIDVQVVEISHVLATEQEIMFDITVEAINPNLVTINVNDMDVNIFAKSRYVGTDSWWRDHDSNGEHFPLLPSTPHRRSRIQPYAKHRHHGADDAVRLTGGVDDGTDPPGDGDLEGDPATMLLGRIVSFDSPLTFEGSPVHHNPYNSSGSVRLSHPGNHTEPGGTARWERVIQHPFELILKGVLRYQMPLSSRSISKSIGASVTVKPEKDIPDDVGDHDGGNHTSSPGSGGNVGPPFLAAPSFPQRKIRIALRV